MPVCINQTKLESCFCCSEFFSAQWYNDTIMLSSSLNYFDLLTRAGTKAKSMKDFIASSGSSSPARERVGLSLSAVKALVLREKEDKLTSEFSSDEKVVHLVNSLFDPGMCILGGLVTM